MEYIMKDFSEVVDDAIENIVEDQEIDFSLFDELQNEIYAIREGNYNRDD